MAGAFLATNLITSSADITVSSEDEDYPLENLYDKIAAKVFRGESTTTLTVLIDFGAAVTIDTLGIINHNFTAGVTLSLKADNSNPPTTELETPVYREHDIWLALTSTSARYWLLTITDVNSAALQIGQLMLGVRTVLPQARRIAEGYKPKVGRSVIGGDTYAGVSYRYYLYQRYEFNPVFRLASDAELAIFQALDTACYGSVYPFLYIPAVSGVNCYYVRRESENFEPEEIGRIGGGNLAYDFSLMLLEEPRGLEILE